MRNHISRYAIVGLLLGLLLVPAMPVQAQFTVWDPTNYALQLAKKTEEANRWLETVRHYATMVDKAVQQLTTQRAGKRKLINRANCVHHGGQAHNWCQRYGFSAENKRLRR